MLLSPKSMELSRRLTAIDSNRPATIPIKASFIAPPSTRAIMLPGCAPSAESSPNSEVRRTVKSPKIAAINLACRAYVSAISMYFEALKHPVKSWR